MDDKYSSILNSHNAKDKNQVRYHFKNLYFINGTFYFYTIEENIEIDNILVIYNDYLNIQVIKLNNKEELNNILDNTEIITITEPTGYAYHYAKGKKMAQLNNPSELIVFSDGFYRMMHTDTGNWRSRINGRHSGTHTGNLWSPDGNANFITLDGSVQNSDWRDAQERFRDRMDN